MKNEKKRVILKSIRIAFVCATLMSGAGYLLGMRFFWMAGVPVGLMFGFNEYFNWKKQNEQRKP